KTLFFEYKTVDELTGYFLQHHREALTKVLGDSQPAPVSQPVGTEKRHKHSRRLAERISEGAFLLFILIHPRYCHCRFGGALSRCPEYAGVLGQLKRWKRLYHPGS
ncbi:hypothetical protein, partial [Bacillus inaquosorum]|uniref:hypothetical protein n=1 Tax=Bacillus inaquosorum TaxID=483913 RepID=UPI002280EBA6